MHQEKVPELLGQSTQVNILSPVNEIMVRHKLLGQARNEWRYWAMRGGAAFAARGSAQMIAGKKPTRLHCAQQYFGGMFDSAT